MNKIIPFDELLSLAAREKAAGKKIVLCHGVFDLLHIGHIRYLRQAAGEGDALIVTLTPDEFVDKGPGRPAFGEKLRAEALASLAFVDYVAVNKWPTAEQTLLALRPDVYAKGAEFKNMESDPTGKIGLEAKAAAEAGTRLVFVEDIVFSSSNLINRFLSIYPEDLQQYLELVRRRYDLDSVLAILEAMRGLKVLVVGDAIIDQYVYCSPLGISSKDPALALRRQAEETYPGGAVAVARHAAGLAGEVTLLTRFGRDCSHLDLVRQSLPPNLGLLNRAWPEGFPTVCKRRYLESYSLAKLLEIYDLPEAEPPIDSAEDFAAELAGIIGDYDLVLAADFGHGAIAEPAVRVLESRAPFLAVNTQANAGNRGYHTIFRYGRADFVSLAQHEMSLAFQDRQTPDHDHMRELARRLKAPTVLLTCGSSGSKILGETGFVQTPAVAARVVDRVGAGDALFAVTALAAKLGAPLELIGLLGNIAGALLVETVGNNRAIDAGQLRKSLTAMLK